MEGSNQMIQIKKETDGSEQENNEILIKVEPEYVFSRYYNEDGGRTYNRRFKEDEDSATGEIDDRDNKSNIDDVSIKTEDNDSSSNTDDNVNNEVNDQAECSGKFEEQIVAWDNKKEEYVYINPASASKLFISKPRKPSKSKLAGKDKFYCNVKGCTFSTSRKSHMLRHEAVHAREAKRSFSTGLRSDFWFSMQDCLHKLGAWLKVKSPTYLSDKGYYDE
ncbi:unnamed protein product [Acanthoscelides obtectus]|uniref:C2H2-type domain-containing protein n=1 Tax=Acanthoscelides obtectus TaxID=200917 RepID=A0A9P0PJ20_ACAOB|nr:unnamed protein product [Acanthoscelides obtectus]CAK1654604.1 hypothetical protein AOBTE_LOCUS18709 [Acanthoscelides obtectus]